MPAKVSRILLIMPEFPPKIGGMQTHAAYLSRHLAARGYRVEVATYQSSDTRRRAEEVQCDRRLSFPVHRILSRVGFWHNLNVVRRLAQKFRPEVIYASTVFYGLLRNYVDAPIICRSVGTDLLRPWMGYPYQFGSGLLSNARLERTVNAWLEQVNYPEWIETAFHERRHELMRDSAREMTRILANSQFTAGLLEELGVAAERIETLVGGVEAARFRRPAIDTRSYRRALGLPENAFILLTACRLVAKKGIDLLLHAVKEIETDLPRVQLVIVGDGKHKTKYQNLTRELGIEERVTFAGRVSHDLIHKYYWCCDLFALTSRVHCNPLTGIKDVETMGRVLCEANAAAIPVVASKSGGIPSIIKHEENGLLFEEDSAKDFIRQVWRIHADCALARHLIQNGTQKAQHKFDWPIVVRRHEQVFAESVRVN
ncbi:MAG: glycosyltransferase family 4 protein [Pyrinomonadaceae bacterium]